MGTLRRVKCYSCTHEWETRYGTEKSGREMACPKCGSSNIPRIDTGGLGRGRGRGFGQGGGRRL